MINKDTNTQCRWTSTFFLLTLYSSLKNFLSGTSNAIFFTSYFFNAFFWRKWTFWGAPCRQDEHPDASFVKMQRFFLSFWHFSPTEVRGQYFWLKPPFKEFRTRVEEQEFTGKIQGHSHYLWPVRFWFLDEFLQGTHLSVILTGTGVARFRWASKVVWSPI